MTQRYGLCECGCGETTPIATRTRRRRGIVKGQPAKLVNGHYARVGKDTAPPNPSGLCQCGCGKTTPIAIRSRFTKGHVRGEHLRYCSGHAPTGEANAAWNGGIGYSNGYVLKRAEDHPRARGKGHYVAEHILVAEATLGRLLAAEEIVHHINHDPRDNRSENLVVMSAGEHSTLHGIELDASCGHDNLEHINGHIHRCLKCGMYAKPTPCPDWARST
jgi:hypothetical protein